MTPSGFNCLRLEQYDCLLTDLTGWSNMIASWQILFSNVHILWVVTVEPDCLPCLYHPAFTTFSTVRVTRLNTCMQLLQTLHAFMCKTTLIFTALLKFWPCFLSGGYFVTNQVNTIMGDDMSFVNNPCFYHNGSAWSMRKILPPQLQILWRVGGKTLPHDTKFCYCRGLSVGPWSVNRADTV